VRARTALALAIALSTTLSMGCLVSIGPFAFGVGSNGRMGSALPTSPGDGEKVRHPGDGMELIFDRALAVYRVPELPDYYHDGDRYHRRDVNGWEHSRHLDGPWRPTSPESLPARLR